MRDSLRTVALTTAISIALAGAGLYSSSVTAKTPDPARTSASDTVNLDSVFIITYSEVGLLEYKGDVQGLARTAPDSDAGQRLNRQTSAARDYEAYLESSREIHRVAIESVLGRTLNITHSYGITFNGIATELTAAEAAKIAALPGVESVKPAGVYHLDMYRGPSFIGADKIWDGSSTPGNVENLGQGVTVGILDTGANSGHPSFANDTSCGFSAVSPKLIAKDCSTSSNGICNGTNPEANAGNGHGVHTAGTVAGNTIDNTVSPPPALSDGMTMAGIAPCAQIYSYKVCETDSCGGAAIAAGIQTAIADGVDVINFSIGGGTAPWGDNDRGFLDAVGNGTFVAASAGNTRAATPNPVGQVSHRGPWVATVAASTHDELISPELSLTGPGTPPASTQEVILTPSSTTVLGATPVQTGAPVKTHTANIEGCTDTGGIPSGTFAGSIAILRRGSCAFTEKINNAASAGAHIVLIANNEAGGIIMDTTAGITVPAFSITQAAGNAIISFLDTNPSNTIADLDPAVLKPRQGDVLADFSFRGPTPSPLADLTKPDITAPGVDIYAATDPGSGHYEFMSGTSMSGPHVAGAGALMVAVHPDWSPMEIRTALMTTAKRAGFQENGTTGWNIDDVGSGRVDVAKAALAGLTMHETKERFIAANPSGGSINVKELNVPSLRNMNCSGTCTWTRTVKNRLGTTGSWTVGGVTDPKFTVTGTPSYFTLTPDEEQTIVFEVVMAQTTTSIAFGYATLTEDSAASPEQHLSVAVKGISATPYTVGGSVSGLTGTGLVLQLNGGNDYSIASDGPFTFPGSVLSGSSYTVTVSEQPADQYCSVTNGSGTVSGDVTNIAVNCVAAVYYPVGGDVSGLTSAGLELKLDGGPDWPVATLPVSADGAFSFTPGLITGFTYTVTIGTQPVGQMCAVMNGTGTIAGAEITDIEVICADVLYTVGGRIQNLRSGGLKLELNGGHEITRNASGLFRFIDAPLTQGTAYEVTVSKQPDGPPAQRCVVTEGSGEIDGEDVGDVLVTCGDAAPEIFEDGFEGAG